MQDHQSQTTRVTRLEVTFTGPYPFVAASAEGGEVVLEEFLPRGDVGYGELVTVTGRDPEAVVAMTADHDGVEVELLVDRPEGGLFKFVLEEPCPATTLAEAGALPRTVEATDGAGRITAEVPVSINVPDLLDYLSATHPGATMVSKRQQTYEAPLFSARDLESAVSAELTDRQREALVAAHEAGYYNSPRGKTAAHLAQQLDISAATLHDHLRNAERKVLSLLFAAAPDQDLHTTEP